MNNSKRLIIILAVIIILALGIIAFIYFFRKSNPPPANLNSNTNNAASNTYSESEPVEYNESYGTICPLGTKFLGKKSAPAIDCTCPAGYEFDSNIIGYETGDNCYGPGTECPIMALGCVREE